MHFSIKLVHLDYRDSKVEVRPIFKTDVFFEELHVAWQSDYWTTEHSISWGTTGRTWGGGGDWWGDKNWLGGHCALKRSYIHVSHWIPIWLPTILAWRPLSMCLHTAQRSRPTWLDEKLPISHSSKYQPAHRLQVQLNQQLLKPRCCCCGFHVDRRLIGLIQLPDLITDLAGRATVMPTGGWIRLFLVPYRKLSESA